MRVLCRLDDIPETGAKGLSLPDGDVPGDIFLVRAQGRVFGYVNSCPHIGTPLEFLPDRFLTRDRSQILCSTHGARFEIATGFCVAGPCRGRSLRRLPVKVEDGLILLVDQSS
jgi:nitrite reductase/ring-hydroxylating ferredoxin subunit